MNNGWCFPLTEVPFPISAGFSTLFNSYVAAWARIGTISVSVFGAKPSLTPLFKWMHRFGTRSIGLLMWINLWLTFPSLPRTIARPANFKSRSNHVFQIPPPYFSAPTLIAPWSDLSDFFLTRRHGESVWAPIIVKPLLGFHLPPTPNAVMQDWLRVTKNLSPGFTCQWSLWTFYRKWCIDELMINLWPLFVASSY